MSEVKRYGHIGHMVNATPYLQELYRDMKVYVLASDFDAAQSELAALREELAKSGSADHLRQRIAFLTTEIHKQAERLTAAEQRNAELFELLRDIYNQNELSGFDDQRILAILKPTESARCSNCDRATVEQCDDAGCGFLGAGNGAPTDTKPTESGASE